MLPVPRTPTWSSAQALGLLVVPLLAGCSGCTCSHAPKELTVHDAAPAPSTSASTENQGPNNRAVMYELGPLPADAPFEGRVVAQVTGAADSERGPATYIFTMAGKKVRWDLFESGGAGGFVGYRVYDAEARKILTVVSDLQVVLATDEVALDADAGANRDWHLVPSRFEQHGAVLDTKCDRFEAHDDDFDYQLCAAPGFVPFPVHLLAGELGKATAFNAALEDKGLFPLASTMRRHFDDKNKPKMTPLVGRFEVVKIERGKVPEKAFALPPLPRVPADKLEFPKLPK